MIPSLHLVTNDRVLGLPRFPAMAAEALEAGGRRICLHVRGPGSGGRVLWERTLALRPEAARTRSLLVVNDRVDVACLLGLDGVHLPERGLPAPVARELMGNARVVGRSMHDPMALEEEERPDYILAGTLYATPSHPGRVGSGPKRVSEIRELNPGVPVIGIGGISMDRVTPVMAAGAHGVALLRAVWDHTHPGRAVEAYLELIRKDAIRNRRSEKEAGAETPGMGGEAAASSEVGRSTEPPPEVGSDPQIAETP